jgi:serine protease
MVLGVVLGTTTAAPAFAAEAGLRLKRPSPQAQTENHSVARVIVKYRADAGTRRALLANAGEGISTRASMLPMHAQRMSELTRVPLRNGRVLGPRTQSLIGSGLSSEELVRRLRARPEVEWAEVDQRRRLLTVPNDPLLSANQPAGTTPAVGQWYLRAPAGEVMSSINALDAWTITTGSPSITVAVLDTGVRPEHPDLKGKLHPGYDFIGLDRGGAADTANDGNGRDPDPTDPGDWTAAGDCGAGERASDSSWHGTQVAGMIGAATNNGIGMAGVGWQVMVLPVRVLGRCGGYDSDIVAGMRWAGGVSDNVGVNSLVTVRNPHPARVINMSLGSTGACTNAYRDAIAELRTAGVVTVVAAGNDTGLAVNAPANCPGAVAVSGVRHVGSKVGFSNIGPEVSIAAPGGNCVNLDGSCLYPLLTTVNAGRAGPTTNGYSDGVNYTVGTSFAAPLVSGTVGLMLSVDPTLTPTRVRELLQSSARPFPTSRPTTASEEPVQMCRAPDGTDQLECFCTTTTCGAGLLDAGAAVNLTLAQRSNSMGSAQTAVIRLNQAFYGSAPSNARFQQLVAQLNADPAGGASTVATSMAAEFRNLPDSGLALMVLNNLKITPATVQTPNSYDILLSALGQLFQAYGPASRGQIVLNVVNLLGNLEADPTWGLGARLFANQTSANFSYASLSSNTDARALSCANERCTISGYVGGLGSGKQLTLLNNAGNATTISAVGGFAFSLPVPTGGSYAVTVSRQPAGQTCTVINDRGTNLAAPVNNVFVSCKNG